jgi:hypothetical protein
MIRIVPFQHLEGRSEQRSDGSGRLRIPLAVLIPGQTELRAFPMKEPDRLDRGQLDDLQDHLGWDGHSTFIVIPGPDRDIEPSGHFGPASIAEQFRAKITEPFGQLKLGSHRLG